jgi:hypothetical protein
MLILLSSMLLAGGPVPPTIGEVFYGHAMGNNDPIPDLTPRAPKLPACRSNDEIQKALTAKSQGQLQSCLTPLGAKLENPAER